MDKIAVLIPCYNEAQTIGKVIRDFMTVLPEAVIYVYDNNSSDETVSIAKKEGAVVRSEKHQGKGNVVRRMFREIDAECYIMVDGDDTYSPEHAREMANEILNKNTDMVIGDRLSSTYYVENKRRFHSFGNNLVRKTINTIFKSNINDIMTGYRALSYQFVKSFAVLSNGFEIETEMTIHAFDKNMNIENIVIDYKDRPEGSQSKLNTFSDGMKVLKTIVNLFRDYKPLSFFGAISLLLFVLAVAFFIPIMIEYINTGLVPNFPTLLVCGFAVIASIQSLFSGLILESIKTKKKQDFEMILLINQKLNK